jgi:hypothetical protein
MDGMSSGELVRGPAQQAVDRLLDQGFLDELMAKVDEGGVRLTGEGGFLPELVKRVLEAGLQAELTDHLGYEKHDRAVHGSGNSRANSLGVSDRVCKWSSGQHVCPERRPCTCRRRRHKQKLLTR